MSDVVARLRSGQMWERKSQNEAADVIEQLQAELVDRFDQTAEHARLNAENERLRALLHNLLWKRAGAFDEARAALERKPNA